MKELKIVFNIAQIYKIKLNLTIFYRSFYFKYSCLKVIDNVFTYKKSRHFIMRWRLFNFRLLSLAFSLFINLIKFHHSYLAVFFQCLHIDIFFVASNHDDDRTVLYLVVIEFFNVIV